MAQISKLIDLVLAYPNFQLGQIIDPEQANLNNLQITNKINLLIKELNKISGNDASGKGASFISVTPLPEIPTATDVETLVTQMWNYLKASTGGNVIGVTKLDGTTGTLQSALAELKTNLETNITQKFTALGVRIDDIEADLLDMSTRFSQNEELIFQNALDITDLQDKTDATDVKVTANTSAITTAQRDIIALDGRTQDLESYATSSVTRIQDLEVLVETALEVSPNAELADARTSTTNSKTYANLDERLEDIETNVKNIDVPEVVYPVTSVNGQTGDVTIVDAVTSVNGQIGNVNIPIPVTSVAGKTGAVTLAKSDVGLGSVENLPLATTAQAQAGVSNSVYMTPLRVSEEIASKATGLGVPYLTTFSASGTSHGTSQWLIKVQHNVDNDSFFKIICGDGSIGVKVDYSNSSGSTIYASDGSHIANEIASLKSTVVSGKTSVANAINGKTGGTLSNQNTFAEYANAINSISSSVVSTAYIAHSTESTTSIATVPAGRVGVIYSPDNMRYGFDNTWSAESFILTASTVGVYTVTSYYLKAVPSVTTYTANSSGQIFTIGYGAYMVTISNSSNGSFALGNASASDYPSAFYYK